MLKDTGEVISECKTGRQKDTRDPNWDQIFAVPSLLSASRLRLTVWDWDILANDFMGTYTLNLADITYPFSADDVLLEPLRNKRGKIREEAKGTSEAQKRCHGLP